MRVRRTFLHRSPRRGCAVPRQQFVPSVSHIVAPCTLKSAGASLLLLSTSLLLLSLEGARGFAPPLLPHRRQAQQRWRPTFTCSTSTAPVPPAKGLCSSRASDSVDAGDERDDDEQPDDRRREEILTRRGEHFALDRSSGEVEFGSTADLVTTLLTVDDDMPSICRWLSVEEWVAASIWEPELTVDLGDSNYRLELMELRFVTISLAPRVDVKMWTEVPPRGSLPPPSSPVFRIRSVGFDPNVQFLPGVGVTSADLGIQIDVAGELRASSDGRGVEGRIGFVTSGLLPPPMRVLPDGLLRGATELINRQIVDFASRSFQRGATAEYRKFRRIDMRRRREAAAAAAAAANSSGGGGEGDGM